MLAEHFPAGATSPLEIVAPVGAAEEAYDATAGQPGIEHVGEPGTSPDGSLVLVDAVLNDRPTAAAHVRLSASCAEHSTSSQVPT